MGKYDDLKKEIKDLINEGIRHYNAIIIYEKIALGKPLDDEKEAHNEISFFVKNYEKWYTASLRLIKTILPEREKDFVILYRDDKRKAINWQNYTISDALQGKQTANDTFHPGNAIRKMLQQVGMLKACLDSFDKKIYDIQVILQADIFDSEIGSAQHLLKMGFLRAAGAICGVVIENHLSTVCISRNITIKKKSPSIADYNDSLKDVAYDTIEWRRIQRLGDLRNLCDHKKDREPTKDEVEELISGTERLIKNIF